MVLRLFLDLVVCNYSRPPPIRTLVIRIANYPDLLGPSGKFVENSTKLTCLEITGYRIKHSTVLWLLELQIRHGRKVYTPVHTVNSSSRTSNCQCSLFAKKIQLSRFSAHAEGSPSLLIAISVVVLYLNCKCYLEMTLRREGWGEGACVCVSVCACVRARVCACVCTCVCVREKRYF